ncbi:hypothetical protein Pmani_000362 [Petrolisthes manimaculis]|uniref:Uncharacterized protein n=1 Tax=Petrolisthes manimaculis TaxID=1843537 RepID=A0AAE1ULF2_9EUCA|nr:hypothetical protein Pmani_000362 [Petrolisthes manimaculis]
MGLHRQSMSCQIFSGKQVRRWQDNALHATAYSVTPNSGPRTNTPILQHHHAQVPPRSRHKTPAALATAPLPPAMQQAAEHASIHQPTARILQWVEDLKSGNDLLSDNKSPIATIGIRSRGITLFRICRTPSWALIS